jgi:hypothetical protein
MATVELQWTDNSGNEDGFNIFRSLTTSPSFPSDFSQISNVGTDVTTFTDSNAPDGQKVHYAVTAFNSVGQSSPTRQTAILLTASATDIDTAAGITQRNRSLTANAIDIDTATATTQRNRSLTGSAADIDTATGVRVPRRKLTANATDIDTATATAQRTRSLTANAADVDTTTATAQRTRSLTANAADIDTASGARVNQRKLTANAADIDSAIAGRFSFADVNDPVRVVADLLEIEPKQAYTITEKPTIKPYFDDAPAERGPGADQPPDIYVFSPTSATLDRHSMDDAQFNRSNTLQLIIMSLDEREVIDLAGDVVNILSKRLQDNDGITPFIDLAPTQVSDFREQKQSRVTDHFVTRVTVETTNLTDTGL